MHPALIKCTSGITDSSDGIQLLGLLGCTVTQEMFDEIDYGCYQEFVTTLSKHLKKTELHTLVDNFWNWVIKQKCPKILTVVSNVFINLCDAKISVNKNRRQFRKLLETAKIDTTHALSYKAIDHLGKAWSIKYIMRRKDLGRAAALANLYKHEYISKTKFLDSLFDSESYSLPLALTLYAQYSDECSDKLISWIMKEITNIKFASCKCLAASELYVYLGKDCFLEQTLWDEIYEWMMDLLINYEYDDICYPVFRLCTEGKIDIEKILEILDTCKGITDLYWLPDDLYHAWFDQELEASEDKTVQRVIDNLYSSRKSVNATGAFNIVKRGVDSYLSKIPVFNNRSVISNWIDMLISESFTGSLTISKLEKLLLKTENRCVISRGLSRLLEMPEILYPMSRFDRMMKKAAEFPPEKLDDYCCTKSSLLVSFVED